MYENIYDVIVDLNDDNITFEEAVIYMKLVYYFTVMN